MDLFVASYEIFMNTDMNSELSLSCGGTLRLYNLTRVLMDLTMIRKVL